MSGGTFDYCQYRLDDAVEEIERRVKINKMTILDHWNSLSDEEKECASDYERPWTMERHPHWIDEDATNTANKALNVRRVGAWQPKDGKLIEQLSAEELSEWNSVRREAIKKCIDEQNNSILGHGFRDEVIAKINEMIPVIKKARIYLERIDWLFTDDDGEDSFLERTKEDLKEEGLE